MQAGVLFSHVYSGPLMLPSQDALTADQGELVLCVLFPYTLYS